MKADSLLAIAAGVFVIWKLLHLPKEVPEAARNDVARMSDDRIASWWNDGEDIEPME